MNFEDFKLCKPILSAVIDRGYTNPTPVQEKAIPIALSGRDLMVSARTGTGKTAVFVLPALERLSVPSVKKVVGPRILILTPTRELALQITEMSRLYGKHMRVRCASIVGGMPYGEQLRQMRGSDIIVATPGRLLDHVERRNIALGSVEMLVLDEADRMLDMGFIDDVKRITGLTPTGRQTLLFSATLDDDMARLAKDLLNSPERVDIKSTVSQGKIEQWLHVVNDVQHKNNLLQSMANDKAITKAIIFSSTRINADKLARKLTALGHTAAALHGDMDQFKRNRVIDGMRAGRVRLLVATDVAARGLDVSGISHVINFDLPKFAEDYVHRIGRTGRAGAPGVAISFVLNGEVRDLERIERFTGQVLAQQVIPGLEPDEELRRSVPGRRSSGPAPDYRGAGGGGGQRPYGRGSRDGHRHAPSRYR
jgi:superfamily II DNA/RNA helicase